MLSDPQSTKPQSASIWDRMLTLPQYGLPQHGLSVLMHMLARSEVSWFKQAFIHFICSKYRVNIDEAAQTDLSAYSSFNAFFTRELRAGVRPLDQSAQVISPVDGAISQLGSIEQGRIIQAKGQSYTTLELLAGNSELAQQYADGQFATIYLSPRDYHRIHMPVTGKLIAMHYVPGRLFSVNPRTARSVPRLFARNERVITVFDTQWGLVTLVLVGAIFVGSMETVWAGQITPPYGKKIQHWYYDNEPVLEQGQEMGRFNMGSTVVLLLPPAMQAFKPDWQPGDAIQLGQGLSQGE